MISLLHRSPRPSSSFVDLPLEFFVEGEMESQFHYNIFERRSALKSKTPAVKWLKEWVPQDVVATGGKCSLFKWVREDTLKALTEKANQPEALDPEPEPTTEVLFFCSYDGCGKTFIDAGALRKHSHIHGERQYVCHYDGCGKKFLDSSKLKRHFLIHTGERDFVCPHEGCGKCEGNCIKTPKNGNRIGKEKAKAFSLDFNLRSHMKTHSQENYHICPYQDCGKRFAHEYKLKNHISSQHEKVNFNPQNVILELPKFTPPLEKQTKVSKAPAAAYGSASSDRPYACPYEGCEKAYIHEYKLKLHLRREHPGHMYEENADNGTSNADNDMDEASDPDGFGGKRVNSKSQKQSSRSKSSQKLPQAKVSKRKASTSASVPQEHALKKPWPAREEAYEEEDSEETEEDRDEDGWRYDKHEDEDEEETEYED